jgi:peptide/nickel transport system permease protein
MSATSEISAAPAVRRRSPTWYLLTGAASELARNPGALIGGIGLLLILGTAVFFPLFYGVDPLEQSLLERFLPPFWQEGGSWAHPLGTDNLGRDLLARVLHGSRISLSIAFAAVLLAAVAGTLLGLLAGYHGGRLDSIVMRLADIFLAYPFMLLTISVIAVLGTSIVNLVIVLGLADWVIYARTIRGSVLSLREKDFVQAARALGATDGRILFRHILPNALSPIIVLATVRMASIIIWESGLSFLGMGPPPPTPTWGRILAEGRNYIADAWWLVTLPGLAIMLTILSINLLGDGLRDALDPRVRNNLR